ncbi:MAG: ABC transporter substrate-binding protein [Rhodospirillales bacterium]|nr:ABC transporter substrate-binding protein [Rhodospirillales bacterium]MDE2576789.1 ABC transporter substrate-binding protein [Rhodospirillales bacterium]
MNIARRSVILAGGAMLATPRARAAQPVRLGLLHTLSPAPMYIAKERGYFAQGGLDVEFRFFAAAQPIAAAVVSGDVDIGITALTGGFYSLAQKSGLKVIGGGLHLDKHVKLIAVLASKKAYAAGLTSLDKLAGHSLGITQYGSSFHYMVWQLGAQFHFDPKTVTLRPLQGISNMVAAVSTGQVDATMAIASMAEAAAAKGDAHIIGWVDDTVPYQITALFTSAHMLTAQPAAVKAFCAGYKKGIADYREAFLRFDAAGKPVYDATTAAVLPMIEKYVFTGDPKAEAKIKAGIGWYDKAGALDVADLKRQVAWFEEQKLVKGRIDVASIVDTRFMPTR